MIFSLCIYSAPHNLSPRRMFYSLAAVVMAEKSTLLSSSLPVFCLSDFFYLHVAKLAVYSIPDFQTFE